MHPSVLLKKAGEWLTHMRNGFGRGVEAPLVDDDITRSTKRDEKAAAPLGETKADPHRELVPLSVNFFPHRQCNYSCGFCFHTEKNSDVLPIAEAQRGLEMLKHCGMVKINFSGGEPFLKPKLLGELCKYCKETLRLESVGIICNGSKVTRDWLDKYGAYLDILGVSCDSFNNDTNVLIGRREGNGRGQHTDHVHRVAEWCHELGIMFKLNTVVNRLNWEEDMNADIERLRPFRWKCFQVLVLEGENAGGEDLRDARKLTVTSEEYKAFLERHANQACLVPESNEEMQDSYLLLDEKLRFLNCEGGKKLPSESILDVGVERAMVQAGFDAGMFVQRGGVYDWTRDHAPPCTQERKDLDW